MIRRHVPAWISRELKYIHPSLGVDYRPDAKQGLSSGPGEWVIYENVRHCRPVGCLYGCRLLEVMNLREPVLIIPANHELGSRVLDWVKQNKISRYNSLDEWMQAHGQKNPPKPASIDDMRRRRVEQKRKRDFLCGRGRA